MIDKKRLLAVAFLLLCASVVNCESIFSCIFEKGKWNPDSWILVKSPRWEHFGNWVQHDKCIENQTPPDATKGQMLGSKAPQTYTSMLLDKKVTLNSSVESTMEFDDRMAPLLVIASELGKDKKNRPEYRDHFEVVLYDKGINIWHHTYTNGKPAWKKTAWFCQQFKPKQKYKIKVELRKTSKGKMMVIFIDDKQIGGYIDESLPDSFYVGITGCEGINRFYDFAVNSL